MKTTLDKWTLPKCYIGSNWPDYYVFLSRNRDSYALERANFEAGLAAVRSVASKEPIPGDEDESATVQVVTENHFLCGWIEWIAIHESDHAALAVANLIMEELEDYPVVDENLWSQYEDEDALITWRNCYNASERVDYIREHRSQFEFHRLSDLIGCVRGKYFAGYASELNHP